MAEFTPLAEAEDVDLGSEEPFWGGPLLNETYNERAERLIAIPNHTISSSEKMLKARELCRLGLNLYFHQNWNWAVMLFSYGIMTSSRGIPWNTAMIDYYVEMVDKCHAKGAEKIYVDFLKYYFSGLLKMFAFQMWQLQPTSSEYQKYQKYSKERQTNGDDFYANIAKHADWRENNKELLATFLTYYAQELGEISKPKLAESCLKLAIELWPEYSDSYWQMGDCLIKKEDFKGAWAYHSKAVEYVVRCHYIRSNITIRVIPADDKFYGITCYKALYVRLMLMNDENKGEVIKDCTKIYEKVREWEMKYEKKYPFDQNDNTWRNTVKQRLGLFIPLASVGKKERNLTDPTKCTVCHMSGVKISRCGRCRKTWYCGVNCQKADWPTHKPDCK